MADLPFNIEGEIWRDVPGLDGEFQVSNIGRVRRLKVYSLTRQNGYMKAVMPFRDRRIQKNAHQLVCAAFHGPPPAPGMVVAHLNGIRDDNRVENLMWATHKENSSHRVLHGTDAVGERNGNCIITEDVVRQIRAKPLTFAEKTAIANKLGVTRGHINDIIKRRCWRHLP